MDFLGAFLIFFCVCFWDCMWRGWPFHMRFAVLTVADFFGNVKHDIRCLVDRLQHGPHAAAPIVFIVPAVPMPPMAVADAPCQHDHFSYLGSNGQFNRVTCARCTHLLYRGLRADPIPAPWTRP